METSSDLYAGQSAAHFTSPFLMQVSETGAN